MIEGLKQETLDTISEEELLKRAGVTDDSYYTALGVSLKAIGIVHKRDPCDVYINNYNPEWLEVRVTRFSLTLQNFILFKVSSEILLIYLLTLNLVTL